MPLDLLKLQPEEAERIAYAEGFTMAAELFARIDALTAERDKYHEALDAIRCGGRNGTMTAAQCAGAAAEVLQ